MGKLKLADPSATVRLLQMADPSFPRSTTTGAENAPQFAHQPDGSAQRGAIIINVPNSGSPPKGGWSDATASIAGALAWPLALAVFLMLFKAPITRFIDRLRTFKGPGMEMSAEAMIEEHLPVRLPTSDSLDVDPYASPIATIITAWVKVEKAARDAAIQATLSNQLLQRTMPYSTVIRNIDALERAGVLRTPELPPLIRDLAKIRNQAVHRPDESISREALIQFVANADWAVSELSHLSDKS